MPLNKTPVGELLPLNFNSDQSTINPPVTDSIQLLLALSPFYNVDVGK